MPPFSSFDETPPAPAAEQEPLKSFSRHNSPGPSSPVGSPALTPTTSRGRQQKQKQQQYSRVPNLSPAPSPTTRGPFSGQSVRLPDSQQPYTIDPNEGERERTGKERDGRRQSQQQRPPIPPQHNPSTINRKPVGPVPAGNSRIASSALLAPTAAQAQTAATQFPNTNNMSRRAGGGPQVDPNGRYWGAEVGYSAPVQGTGVTPGADNFSEKAAGGMAGIAYSVADQHAKQSGMDAKRPADPNYPQEGQYRSSPSQRSQHQAYSEQSGQQYDQQYDARQQPYHGGGSTPAPSSRDQQQYAAGYDQRQYQHGGYYNNSSSSSPQQHYHQQQPYDQAAGYDSRQGYSNGYDSGYDNGGYNHHQPPPSRGGRHSPYDDQHGQSGYGYGSGRYAGDRDSANSITPLGGGVPPGRATPTYHDRYAQRSPYGGGPPNAPGAAGVGYGLGGDDMYSNDPYQRYASHQDRLGQVNPNEIADDGDDGLEYRRPARSSLLSLGRSSNHDGHSNHGVAAGAVAGAGVIAAASAAGKSVGNRLSGMYASVANSSSRSVNNADSARNVPGAVGAGGAGSGAASLNGGSSGLGAGSNAFEMNNNAATSSNRDVNGGGGGGGSTSYLEKPSDWLEEQKNTRKKWKWIIGGIVVLLILGGIACGIVFGVVLKKNGSSSGSSSGGGGSSEAAGGGGGMTAAEDTAANGDLDINSKEIQGLLNNANLHKVFPAIDYTALNTQYPNCLEFPASQNNVTRDIAVLSQLTDTVRLYGTDCNQTQMVLHAIERLEMKDTMKVWLGVWQDGNTTTNARQLAQMWDILDEYGTDQFLGVIVANEILFREEMTMTELQTLLQDVRDNLTARGHPDFIVATSDLGDNWTQQLASISDAIMGNIHPFFAGIDVTEASQWTTTFWDGHIGTYKKAENKLNIISETGWPTAGGSINSSVAGIDELNRFMADWVCRAMDEKINYFWFEAFDEPWKIQYNTPGKEWEDKWGVLTVNREVKDGVTIPDCNGMTVDQVDW